MCYHLKEELMIPGNQLNIEYKEVIKLGLSFLTPIMIFILTFLCIVIKLDQNIAFHI